MQNLSRQFRIYSVEVAGQTVEIQASSPCKALELVMDDINPVNEKMVTAAIIAKVTCHNGTSFKFEVKS